MDQEILNILLRGCFDKFESVFCKFCMSRKMHLLRRVDFEYEEFVFDTNLLT